MLDDAKKKRLEYTKKEETELKQELGALLGTIEQEKQIKELLPGASQEAIKTFLNSTNETAFVENAMKLAGDDPAKRKAFEYIAKKAMNDAKRENANILEWVKLLPEIMGLFCQRLRIYVDKQANKLVKEEGSEVTEFFNKSAEAICSGNKISNRRNS
jgi:hypothetical protein